MRPSRLHSAGGDACTTMSSSTTIHAAEVIQAQFATYICTAGFLSEGDMSSHATHSGRLPSAKFGKVAYLAYEPLRRKS